MLQAPAGNNSGVTNGSASVPFNTTLVFDAGVDAQSYRTHPCTCRTRAARFESLGTPSESR